MPKPEESLPSLPEAPNESIKRVEIDGVVHEFQRRRWRGGVCLTPSPPEAETPPCEALAKVVPLKFRVS